jgi:N-acetylglucosamine-6-phosphate deacetylase
MSTHRLGVAAALVDGQRVPGDVEVDAGRVSAVGVGSGGGTGLAVAGFVDLQVNGFAGVDFTATDLDGYRRASTAMARTGVTSFLVTIPTSAPDRYDETLDAATAAVRSPLPGARAVGIHLEGPFLSPDRAGAHRREWLRAPSAPLVDALLGGGEVALVTVAPEIEGGLDLVGRLRREGTIVSVGHTDATAEMAHRAFDAGASAITHLWNAHRPITSRDPGAGGAALARPDVFVCAIADLVHVAPETLRFSSEAAGARFVVVSDAVAPAGMQDGAHRFGTEPVTLHDGAVRLSDGTLAGSACPLDRSLRNLVGLGLPLERALGALGAAPGRLLGRPDVGVLAVDGPADIVVLDDDLAVVRVLVAGAEVHERH